MEPAINPLCDKDLGSMSPNELVTEGPGEFKLISAYDCDLIVCSHCHNEGAGYFDYVVGKLILGNNLALIRTFSSPVYLKRGRVLAKHSLAHNFNWRSALS
jgi:hypothetical protein